MAYQKYFLKNYSSLWSPSWSPSNIGSKHWWAGGCQLSGHPVASSMMSSLWKCFLWHNLGWSAHIWRPIKAVFNISKFQKWLSFWSRDKLCHRKWYRKLGLPVKIAMNVSNISSFCSTLYLKYLSWWKNWHFYTIRYFNILVIFCRISCLQIHEV